jgi:uncharacterized protein YggE
MPSLLALLAIVALGLTAGCASVGGRRADAHGITVIGTGRVMRSPDTAVVQVGVESRSADLGQATADVDRRVRLVLEGLRAQGVRDADIRTIAYAIDPVAEPRPPGDSSPRIAGYRVSNVVQVRTGDLARLAPIVDAAVRAGANVVRNIQLMLDDPARAEAEARTLAVQDAMAKARQAAAAAGVGLGRLLSLTESSPVRPVSRMALATAPGPIEPGHLEITVSLEARYAIEP